MPEILGRESAQTAILRLMLHVDLYEVVWTCASSQYHQYLTIVCAKLLYALFPKWTFSLFDQPKVCLDVNLWRSTGAQNNERCAVCWLMTPDGLTNSVREYVRLYMYYMWTLCKDVELLHSVISFLITREAGLDTPSNKAFCIVWWFHMISMREHHHFSIRGQDLWNNSYQQLLVDWSWKLLRLQPRAHPELDRPTSTLTTGQCPKYDHFSKSSWTAPLLRCLNETKVKQTC